MGNPTIRTRNFHTVVSALCRQEKVYGDMTLYPPFTSDPVIDCGYFSGELNGCSFSFHSPMGTPARWIFKDERDSSSEQLLNL